MCCDRHLEIPGVSNNTTETLEQKKTNSWTFLEQLASYTDERQLSMRRRAKQRRR